MRSSVVTATLLARLLDASYCDFFLPSFLSISLSLPYCLVSIGICDAFVMLVVVVRDFASKGSEMEGARDLVSAKKTNGRAGVVSGLASAKNTD